VDTVCHNTRFRTSDQVVSSLLYIKYRSVMIVMCKILGRQDVCDALSVVECVADASHVVRGACMHKILSYVSVFTLEMCIDNTVSTQQIAGISWVLILSLLKAAYVAHGVKKEP
jgi:hypothetical protein